MPAGRPTVYDPAYCEKVIELGKLGMSVVEMAAEIGVSRNTLETEWPKRYPEFLEAFTQAKVHSQAWWESMGRVNLIMPQGSGSFQASVWSRSMAARFPSDWREKQEQTIQGPDGGPVSVITRKIVDPKA
jgi:lambda repressor-like predicted transcriptional regulator